MIVVDFSMAPREDVTLNVTISGQNILGWELEFSIYGRFGGTPLVTKSTATSGQIVITNAPDGAFAIRLNSIDTSGFQVRNNAFDVRRVQSGAYGILSQGYQVLTPG